MQKLILVAAIVYALSGAGAAHALDLYVASSGNDAWSGTTPRSNRAGTDGPFATLVRARDTLRALKQNGKLAGPSTVWVRAGTYFLDQPLELTGLDSGTADSPITYRAYANEHVTLSGGREVRGFVPYKGKILQADVRSLSLDKLQPTVAGSGIGGVPKFDLYCGGQRMDLARWPNRVAGDPHYGDWAYVGAVPKAGSKTDFAYSGERPSMWAHPEAAQIHIFANYGWQEDYVGIKSIDTAAHLIQLRSPTGYEIKPGRRYIVRNVFEELDAPGEWYFDRSLQTLYFWPPAEGASNTVVSALPSIINLANTSYVTIQGFTLEASLGDAVRISGGAHNLIAGCVIRHTGGSGVTISEGENNGASGNDVYDIGQGGIHLSGGDRIKLQAAGNYADNNHIHDFGQIFECYRPAVSVNGVGNRVTHNLIHDGPHAAILLGGNDHLVEYNIIHDVCLNSSDCGAFYVGRDWTYRGNVIRYNEFHDIQGYGFSRIDSARGTVRYTSPSDAQAIYLDDATSAYQVYGNIVYRVGDLGVELGAGRDTTIENNIFVDCGRAISVDNRWETFDWNALQKNLNAMPYQTPPWSDRYPELARPMRNYKWPEGDSFVGNIVAISQQPVATPLLSFIVPPDLVAIDRNLYWNAGGDVQVSLNLLGVGNQGNLAWNNWQAHGFDAKGLIANPLFVDAAHSDFRLRKDSPAFRLGFRKIPVEKFGLYKDRLRASWPVEDSPQRVSVAPKTYEFPIAGWKPLPVSSTHLEAMMLRGPVAIDSTSAIGAWPGATAANALILNKAPDGAVLMPPSMAWLAWDASSLYVAIHNDVNPAKPLASQAHWGVNDAVEVALRDSSKPHSPILVWRGYPNGKFETSTEAGASIEAANRALLGVQYVARIENSASWDATWRIPFASIGIDPGKTKQLDCNLSVRKTADDQWVMWQSTGGYTWDVDHAGRLVLAVPAKNTAHSLGDGQKF